MLSLVIAQLCLGFTAFLTRVAWGHDAVQPELPMVISTVAHVAVGALLLATTVILSIQVWRHVPVAFEERVPQVASDPTSFSGLKRPSACTATKSGSCVFAGECHGCRKLDIGFGDFILVSKVSALADAGPEVEHSSAASVISVQNLVHRYENRTALNGVSFDVRPAELFGLLGPNGSGKTTLFRILSTLMIPTAGHAVVMGCDAAQDPRMFGGRSASCSRRRASIRS